MQYTMNTSYNTDTKLSLATLVNTEEFKKASEKFWIGIPGKSECYPSEINTYNNFELINSELSQSNNFNIGAYDHFKSILNTKDWNILQNWLMEGDNPEWNEAINNNSDEKYISIMYDNLNKK
jgi:hypothetical protein